MSYSWTYYLELSLVGIQDLVFMLSRFKFQSRHVICCLLLLCVYTNRNAEAQWVEQPGHGWVQLGAYHHDTTKRFDEQRNVESLFNEDSRSITTSLILTGAIGVYKGVDIWGQLPVHRLAFNDIAANRESSGLGDPRFHIRIGPSLFGWSTSIPVAIRGGVKFAIGDFPVDSEIVPLTEGQRDWELLMELGHSFYPTPVYAMAWAGYRWREKNDDIERKPGDEFFAYAALGGEYERWIWKLALEGQWGERWVSFTGARIELARSERELIQVQPSIGWKIGPGVIELGARMPVWGRNFPAGPALFVGYFYSWR